MIKIPESSETTKEIIMVPLRFTSLLLGLLLSLVVVLGVPRTVLAGKEVTMIDNDQALGSANELGDGTQMIATTQTGRLKGRKIGAEEVLKKEARNEMNTGKDMNSPNKLYGTPNSEDTSTLEPTNFSNSYGNLESQDPYQTMGTQKLMKAIAEIYKMMNKDYHQNAHRRPPINNHLPLEAQNNNVAP